MSDDEYYQIPPGERTQEAFDQMRKDWGNNTLVGWKLEYVDGTSIRSTDIAFDEAPQDGVLFLFKYYRRARGGYSKEPQNGLDLYVLYSDKAEELDLPPQVKKGVNLPNAEWDKRLAKARADEEVVIGMQDADLYRED